MARVGYPRNEIQSSGYVTYMIVVTEEEQTLVDLTCKAREAAVTGQWDLVIDYYTQRGASGFLKDVSPKVAKELVTNDKWMMTRIREVQALTQQNLGAVQDHRRKLDGLKRQWVAHQTGPIQHRLSI